MKTAIILAAGLSKRMGGKMPKVLSEVNGKTLIEILLNSVYDFFDRIILVVGFRRENVINRIKPFYCDVFFATQEKQLGTADAVRSAFEYLPNESKVFILNGDTPLLRKQALLQMERSHIKNRSDLTVGVFKLNDPTGYGRVITEGNRIKFIVEEKDADASQKKIDMVNGGLYLIDSDLLKSSLEKIENNNAQGEYYLTDIVEVVNSAGKNVLAHEFKDHYQLLGVNTPRELEEVKKYV